MNGPVASSAQGIVRPFARQDAAAVAALFKIAMEGNDAPAGDDLTSYFRRHYLEGPFADPDIPALVHLGPNGEIDGFGGRVVQSFRFRDRALKAAIIGTLMVRDHGRSPMAGARLLKALKDGPQDLTLSETAGDASLAMWRQLRGDVLERHSLDFIRVLKPSRYAVELLSARIRAARLLAPLAALPDRALAAKAGPLRWTGLPNGFRPERGVRAGEIGQDDFAALFVQFTGASEGEPLWPGDSLAGVIAEAMEKRAYGTAYLRAVTTGSGKPVGAFLLHFDGAGPARVTEIVHAPGQAGPVLDALFAEAQALGASSVRGRIRPALLDALLSRRVLLAHESASVIAARDPQVASAFERGEIHFNGLVGERWMRLIGDRFDPAAVRSRVNPDANLSGALARPSL